MLRPCNRAFDWPGRPAAETPRAQEEEEGAQAAPSMTKRGRQCAEGPAEQHGIGPTRENDRSARRAPLRADARRASRSCFPLRLEGGR